MAANLIMWCHELKRTCSATSPGSRVINPGFLRAVVTLHPDTVKIGINNILWWKEWDRCVGILADILDDGMGHDR
jgi:hypothetical protein